MDADDDWRAWLARHRDQFEPRFTQRGEKINCITCGDVRPLMMLGRVMICEPCVAELEPSMRAMVRQALENGERKGLSRP